MFNAKFISRNKGVSAKSGMEWFQMEFIASTVSGGAKVLRTFCTASAYENSLGLQPMQECKALCGVTDNGFLTVSAVKGA